MQTVLRQPFSNVQLELLKTFSHQLTESELIELKKTLALFFAEKLIKKADQVWVDEKWDDEKGDAMLTTKMRNTKNKS